MIRLLSGLFLSIFCLWIAACQVQIKQKIKTYAPALSATSPFAFVPKGTTLPSNSFYLGQLKNTAYFAPIDCDYESIIDKLEIAGKKSGGNLGVIVQDKKMRNPPDCHEIRVDLYSLDDISPYESRIIWSPNRKLNSRDFKGVKLKRSSRASAYLSVPYHYSYRLRELDLSAKAMFDCKLSYWADSVSSKLEEADLDFFQFLFDIQEVYKRCFLSQLKVSVKQKYSVTQKIDSVYQSVQSAHELKEDAFRLAVKSEKRIPETWHRWKFHILDSLKIYEDGKVRLNLKP